MPEKRLPDIVAKDLRILLVAINPPPVSLNAGHHFATPKNPFWDLLHAAGLTRTRLQPEDARQLLDESIGLTSLVHRATRMASELSRAELRVGAVALEKKVARLKPRIVALVGLTLFPVVFPDTEERGPGLKKVTIAGAKVFVVPNPSGRNRAYPGFAAKLHWYEALARYAARRRCPQ